MPLTKSIFVQQVAMAGSALCFLPMLEIGGKFHFLVPFLSFVMMGGLFFIIYKILGRRSCTGFVQSLMYYFLQGVIFAVVMFFTTDDRKFDLRTGVMCGVGFIIGIVAGQITPGAPAGIGVRETVVLYSVSGIFEEGQIAVAVALTRVANIIGDILLFAAAVAVPGESHGGRNDSA